MINSIRLNQKFCIEIRRLMTEDKKKHVGVDHNNKKLPASELTLELKTKKLPRSKRIDTTYSEF